MLAAPLASAQEVVPGDTASTAASRAAAWYARPAVGVQVGYSRTDLALGGAGNLLTSRQGAITGSISSFRCTTLSRSAPNCSSASRAEAPSPRSGPGEDNIDIELAYIELPVLLRGIVPHRQHPTGPLRRPRHGDPDRVRLQLRPRQRLDPVHLRPGQSDHVRSWDFGLVAGGGVEKRLRRATIALEARYTLGTRSILEDVELKNRAFGLVLAVTF